MKSDKKSFVLYSDYGAHINKLTDEEAGKLLKAIFEYVDCGKESSLPPMAEMAFSFIASQLQRDLDKWNSIREKRASAGRTGGKAKQANASFVRQIVSNQAVTDTVNATATVNENGNVTDTVKKAKHKYGSLNNVLLTDDEHEKLVDKFGESKANHWIDVLSEGIAMKGYKYKSHYLAILKWIRNGQPIAMSNYVEAEEDNITGKVGIWL